MLLPTAWAAIICAMGMADVAAGEGALPTCSMRSVLTKRKSCTSAPSRVTACARMPALARHEILEGQAGAVFPAFGEIAGLDQRVSPPPPGPIASSAP